MRTNKSKQALRRRHLRLRQKISGTTARPRLNVFRSLANIYAQVTVSYTHLTLPTKLEWCRSRWSPYH